MKNNQKRIPEYPLGKETAVITKLYLGVLSEKLRDIDLDRFFYPLVLISEGKGKLTQQALAEKFEIDKVTTVRVVDYLSKKGYVTRVRNEADRREHFLKLTKKGKNAVPRIKKALEATNQDTIDGLTAGETDQLFDLLGKIRNNLLGKPGRTFRINFRKTKK